MEAGGCWGHWAQWFTVSSVGHHTVVAGMRGTNPDAAWRDGDGRGRSWMAPWRAGGHQARARISRAIPSSWWWNVGRSRGVRIRRCAFAPWQASTPSGPSLGPGTSALSVLCLGRRAMRRSVWINLHCAAGSPHLPNAAGVCLGGRLTGQHARCCVALR